MDDYPPNSRKAAQASSAQQEPKNIERVTTAEAQQRKQGLGKQFRKTFVGGDAKTTVNYVFFSVLLPAARDMLVDAGSQGLERLIYGETRRGKRPSPPSGYSGLGHVNYGGMHTRTPPARQISQQSRQAHNFGDIQVESRVEANNVLDRMYDLLSKYDVVTVADLYALTGISGTHVDHKWGWTNLQGASARRTRSGDHLLDLPDPEFLG